MLPTDVLTDLVRSYMGGGASVVPQFLQASFEMLRDGQSKVMENVSALNPMSKMPGFEMMQAQQEAFMKAMTGGLTPGWGASEKAEPETKEEAEDLASIKKQLAELQEKLSKMS